MDRRFIYTGFIPALLAACVIINPAPIVVHTPTAALSPAAVLTPAPAATSARVTLAVKKTLINCRFGPGVTYELINELSEGDSARVVGRNESSTWWYVRDPGDPNGHCWVSADVTETQGDVDQLPLIQPPFVTVTRVRLRAEPNRIVVNCDQFPQTIFLEAEVSSNGPTFVSWKWEASTGVSSIDTVLVFEKAGTQVINDYYQIGAPNEYWVKLHILAPNEWVEEVKFPVSCTP